MKQNLFQKLKITSVLLLFFIAQIAGGCNQIRYITERHIKNEIEQHRPGEFSNVRTYVIYRAPTTIGTRYVELTGYKYKGKKALVIGVDRIVVERKKFKEDNTLLVNFEFTELTLEQAQSILDQYKVLLDKIKTEKPIKNESVYHDFTLSPEVFISFKKTKSNKGTDTINFWIKGEKYSMLQGKIIERLREFVRY